MGSGLCTPVAPVDARTDEPEIQGTTDGAGAASAPNNAARAVAGGGDTPSSPFVELIAACVGEDESREQLRTFLTKYPPDALAGLEREKQRKIIDVYASAFREWREKGAPYEPEYIGHRMPGVEIEETALRGITLNQLEAFFEEAVTLCEAEGWCSTHPERTREQLARRSITLYDLAQHHINPLAQRTGRSVVESLAHGPQPPAWFVSHWWGEPVHDMLVSLKRHREDRGLSEDTAYWICAYALRQSALGLELKGGVADTPFVRALHLADGTVSVLDSGAVALSRAWCALELYETVISRTTAFLHDVYTTTHVNFKDGDYWRSVGHGLVDGLADARDNVDGRSSDGRFKKKTREEALFPKGVLDSASGFALRAAQAAREEDLRAITDSVGADVESLDATVRARFGVTMLQALLAADASAAQESALAALLVELKASRLRKLALGSIETPSADSLARLLAALPASLRDLSVYDVRSNGWVPGTCALVGSGQLLQLTANAPSEHFRDGEVEKLGAALGATGCRLALLDLRSNRGPSSGGWAAIGAGLAANGSLTSLDLRHCGTTVSDATVEAIGPGLAAHRRLRTLDLSFDSLTDAAGVSIGCALETNRSLTSLDLSQNALKEHAGAAIGTGLKTHPSLTYLDLRNNGLAEDGGAAIGAALKTNRSLKSLNLCTNRLGKAAGAAIFGALKANDCLTDLFLGFNRLPDGAAIGNALKANTALRTLDLGVNMLDKKNTLNAIRVALKAHDSLQELNLGGNPFGMYASMSESENAQEALRSAWAASGSRDPKHLHLWNIGSEIG